MKNKKQTIWRYAFAVLVILVGLVLEAKKIGNEYLGFKSVGIWLAYVGFIMLIVITLQNISNKKRIVDERMLSIAFKATRVTFLAIILGAFLIMIIDGVKPITAPYGIFMSYIIAFMMIIYFSAYKILEHYN